MIEDKIPEGNANMDPEEGREKLGFFARIKKGLTKTRENLGASLDKVFGGYEKITEDFYDELEETLIMADLGAAASEQLIWDLRDEVWREDVKDVPGCRQLLAGLIARRMALPADAYAFEEEPSIVLVMGVNGVGKTTTVGKLAASYRAAGKKVLIASADTFRAAAGDQLKVWADRAGVDLIGAPEGSDPASVIFDSVRAAKARGVDILLCDTAGRLHNKKNLMEELRKMDRIIQREFPEARRENWVVLDAATGQNALSQAREFGDIAALTGVVLTKMDGSARGGVAVGVVDAVKAPVKFIGVGEKIDDLQRFDARAYAEGLILPEGESLRTKEG